MTSPAPELLRTALIDLLIAAAPFRHGRGRSAARGRLDAAIGRGRAALTASAAEGLGTDWRGLAELAAEADAETEARPGFRADLDG
ncbi:hypothetical protein [Roseospirillum parvum]|uniref:Uncharacterized protein n=1 Tax=Roseospirillum parvum TaxID=83401 RepID=A0A1G8GJL9_9PROT|nr:hypothetical protein [Roseospirillum parvum]SDH94526.1 hypothetical protein SAMN05421742_1294 [Roseospirillum parvum]